MYEKLQKRVDDLFKNAPDTKRAEELKEELMANLIDRYNDLTESGKSEDEAIDITIEGIGDVNELIRSIGIFSPSFHITTFKDVNEIIRSIGGGTIPVRKDSRNQYEEEMLTDGCDKVRLNFSNYDIEVSTTNEDKIRVVQSSSEKISREEKMTVTRDGRCINIRGNDRSLYFNLFNFGSSSNKIELYIPRSYHQDLEITTKSGDIGILEELELNNLTCSQVSGALEVKRNVYINNFTSKTTSGDMKIPKLEAEFYKISTISGDINIRSLSGSGDISAISGNVNLNSLKLNEYINIKSISGDIDVSAPDNTGFIFEANTVSGDIDSDFNMYYKNKRGNKAEITYGDGPFKKISVSTVSGDINLNK
ncbi:MAG: DUF4097 family beta strand repeat-containing protein [Clostridiaceae bacterium]